MQDLTNFASLIGSCSLIGSYIGSCQPLLCNPARILSGSCEGSYKIQDPGRIFYQGNQRPYLDLDTGHFGSKSKNYIIIHLYAEYDLS